MLELLRRLAIRPGLTTELIGASLFANMLALATPLFVILVLNRYVAHGVDATLMTLSTGALIAIALEFRVPANQAPAGPRRQRRPG
jgi:ATP-binding cassette subfamily C protein LapB